MRRAVTDSRAAWFQFRVGSLGNQRRCFSADFFMGDKDADPNKKEVFVKYDHKHQPLQAAGLAIHKEAFGIPFHISDEAALDAACRHHGATVRVHESEKLLMPYWLFRTSCGGSFTAEILLDDPNMLTSRHKAWVDTPEYEFSYPLDDHFPFNQVSASYLHPSKSVESCLSGTHIPSMMMQRFELVKEMDEMTTKARLIPFVMSTATALKIVETRLTRSMVLRFVEKELKKYHGSFTYSNTVLRGVRVEANAVRPVFLPMYKMMVSTRHHAHAVPVYVCGATGTAKGPALLHFPRLRTALATVSAVGTLVGTVPFVGPEVAITCGVGAAIFSSFLMQVVTRAKFLKDSARELGELKTTGLLNFASDQQGYRWTVEDEERSEFEYREELRRRARRKDDFQQRVQEEQARDEARARGVKFDPKNRRRNDLRNVDPLGYYKLLGLEGKEIGATLKEIQHAFREESKKHHPDLHANNDDAAKKLMQQILQAYKVLRNPETKKIYDSGKMTEKEVEEAS